jgi:hypothetical protein
MPVNNVTRQQVANALMEAKIEKQWQATTYNNEHDTLINLFNWLEREEYMIKIQYEVRSKRFLLQNISTDGMTKILRLL